MTLTELKSISGACKTDKDDPCNSSESFFCPIYGIDIGNDEVWVPIPDRNGYEVSNYGRVRSYKIDGYKPRLLRPQPLRGYRCISLWDCKRHRPKQARIHQLVLLCFVGPRPNKMEACHADGNRWNNKLSNLRWDTRTGNMLDCAKYGTKLGRPHKGEKNGVAKLKDRDIPIIRSMYSTGMFTSKQIGLKYGVGPHAIQKVISRKNWKHIP